MRTGVRGTERSMGSKRCNVFGAERQEYRPEGSKGCTCVYHRRRIGIHERRTISPTSPQGEPVSFLYSPSSSHFTSVLDPNGLHDLLAVVTSLRSRTSPIFFSRLGFAWSNPFDLFARLLNRRLCMPPRCILHAAFASHDVVLSRGLHLHRAGLAPRSFGPFRILSRTCYIPFGFSTIPLPHSTPFKALQQPPAAAAVPTVPASSSGGFGRSSGSKITRICRLQLGQTAISSPSRRSSMLISKRSPQGHG